MSMQQLGGGPPGDEDYFNLEDEETQEASSGERNPNVSAWDPEKMELLRIVDRLLEERRNLPPRPAEQPVLHKVKLPPFRGKKMATWLGLTEAVLEDNSLRDPRVMYIVQDHAPPKVHHNVLERARGVPCRPGSCSEASWPV